MAFSIHRFKTENRLGFLRPSKFEFTCSVPSGLASNIDKSTNIKDANDRIRFVCESTTLPGVGLQEHKVRPYGYGLNESRPAFPNFQKTQVSFLMDNDGNTWKFFYEWLSMISNFKNDKGSFQAVTNNNGPDSFMSPYEMSYREKYVVDCEITSFDVTSKEKIKVKLRDAFPLQMADLPLDWKLSSQIMRLPVVFSYSDWHLSR